MVDYLIHLSTLTISVITLFQSVCNIEASPHNGCIMFYNPLTKCSYYDRCISWPEKCVLWTASCPNRVITYVCPSDRLELVCNSDALTDDLTVRYCFIVSTTGKCFKLSGYHKKETDKFLQFEIELKHNGTRSSASVKNLDPTKNASLTAFCNLENDRGTVESNEITAVFQSSSQSPKTRKVVTDKFPVFSRNMPQQVFVSEGKDAVVNCQFESDNVKPYLKVDNTNVDLTTRDSLKSGENRRNEAEVKHSLPLHIKVSPVNPQRGETLEYTALRMKSKDPATKLSSTHRVICIGENEKAEFVRATVLVKAFPRMRFDPNMHRKLYTLSNCSDGSGACIIPCNITNEAEYSELSIERTWRLGDVRLDALHNDFRKHFSIVRNGNGLKIDGNDDAKFVTEFNAAGRLQCIVNVYHTPSSLYGERLSRLLIESTEQHRASTDMLTFNVQMVQETSVGHSRRWSASVKPATKVIVSSVVGCLVLLLILIIPVAYMCKRRRPQRDVAEDPANIELNALHDPETPDVEV